MDDFPALTTRVVGVTYDNPDGSSRQRTLALVRKGDVLALRREPLNAFDGQAIAVDWLDTDGAALQIGYVPSALAALLAPLIDAGARFRAIAQRPRGGSPGPLSLRVRLEAVPGTMPRAGGAGGRSGLEPGLSPVAEAPADAGLAPALGGGRRTVRWDELGLSPTPSDEPSA